MLNKLYSLSRYKTNSEENKKNVWCIFTLMLGSLSLAIDTRYNFVTIFLQQFLSVRLHFLLQFGLIGCMILIKEYVSLTTAATKIGKRHFYSDHSNGC